MTRGSVASRDAHSCQWVDDLRSEGAPRHRAIARLHSLLARAAEFEVARRRARPAHLGAEEAGDIARQAAANALVSLLSRLDDYRGESPFTTWASKFALFEAAVAVRGRAWQERELPESDRLWAAIGPGGPSAGEGPAVDALLSARAEGGSQRAQRPRARRVHGPRPRRGADRRARRPPGYQPGCVVHVPSRGATRAERGAQPSRARLLSCRRKA